MDDKIILFPKMRKELEQEVNVQMKQNNYTAALKNLNELVRHGFTTYTIHIQFIHCYIKLKRYNEAALFCEELLEKHDSHYYDYVDYYIMILYEAGKYKEVVERINEEQQSGELSEELFIKLSEIKKLAKQMNEWESLECIKNLRLAVQEGNVQRQYYLIRKWQTLQTEAPEYLYKILTDNTIHPVIKTIILIGLREQGVSTEVNIQKFSNTQKVIPKSLPGVKQHPIYLKTFQQLEIIEQDNPTLFELLKELFEQYCFVIYPIMYEEDRIDAVINALLFIAQSHLGFEQEKENKPFVEQIGICCHLYQQIMLQ